MSDRESLILEFLAKNKLTKATRQKLSSDASFRGYERISGLDKSCMLMNAPPGKEDISPFINIGNYLKRRGFSSPEIYSSDIKNGLMLLEDLGDDSFTNVLAGHSDLSDKYTEKELYLAAMDVLIQLDRLTLPSKMPDYDGALLLKECKLLTDWYLPNAGESKVPDGAESEYSEIWEELLEFKKVTEDVVVMRDYHADNLMWLPDRVGVQNVGLLDFQDAVIGSPVYDIVSLLEDARRDVSKETVGACIKHYLKIRKSVDKKDFLTAYAILAAQRNCKIIGIFARLAIREGKIRYLNYLPRVWAHLEYDLQNESLAPLKKWMDKYIPKKLRTAKAFSSYNKEYAVG